MLRCHAHQKHRILMMNASEFRVNYSITSSSLLETYFDQNKAGHLKEHLTPIKQFVGDRVEVQKRVKYHKFK